VKLFRPPVRAEPSPDGRLITFQPSLPILWVSLVRLRLNMTESRRSSQAERGSSRADEKVFTLQTLFNTRDRSRALVPSSHLASGRAQLLANCVSFAGIGALTTLYLRSIGSGHETSSVQPTQPTRVGLSCEQPWSRWASVHQSIGLALIGNHPISATTQSRQPPNIGNHPKSPTTQSVKDEVSDGQHAWCLRRI
jgi:hypothetical protein